MFPTGFLESSAFSKLSITKKYYMRYLYVVLKDLRCKLPALRIAKTFASPLELLGPCRPGEFGPRMQSGVTAVSFDADRAAVHGWETGLSLVYRDGQCCSHFRSEGNCGTGNGQSLGLMDSVPGSTTSLLCDPGQVLPPPLWASVSSSVKWGDCCRCLPSLGSRSQIRLKFWELLTPDSQRVVFLAWSVVTTAVFTSAMRACHCRKYGALQNSAYNQEVHCSWTIAGVPLFIQ